MEKVHIFREEAIVFLSFIWINFHDINSIIFFFAQFCLKNILLHYIFYTCRASLLLIITEQDTNIECVQRVTALSWDRSYLQLNRALAAFDLLRILRKLPVYMMIIIARGCAKFYYYFSAVQILTLTAVDEMPLLMCKVNCIRNFTSTGWTEYSSELRLCLPKIYFLMIKWINNFEGYL